MPVDLDWTLSRWVGVAAVVLAGCSGAFSQYATRVARPPDLDVPLIDARRCLETVGFEMKIVDFEAGLVSGERFELTDGWSPTIVVSEVSVISGEDSVTIIARSRRASSTSEGWESVRISEHVRRAVDRLADRLDGGPSGATVPCGSFFTHQQDR